MYPIKEMDHSLESMCPTNSIFDLFRIVDPVTNQVFRYQSGSVFPAGHRCFDIWNRDRPCSNCISKRAACEQTQVMKLEYLDGRVNLIWALPVELPAGPYVIELAKDVTESMMVSDIMHRDNTEITTLILEFNQLAIQDVFTGLYNKKYIETEFPLAVRRALEQNTPLCAAVVDIDYFKQVNDRYGHQSGDQVILALADCIRSAASVGKSWSARMGGDEFLLVFEQMELPDAQERCSEMAGRFSRHEFGEGEETFTVSVSVGLKEFHSKEDGEDNFLEHVDELMYDMKRARHSAGE